MESKTSSSSGRYRRPPARASQPQARAAHSLGAVFCGTDGDVVVFRNFIRNAFLKVLSPSVSWGSPDVVLARKTGGRLESFLKDGELE